MRENLLVFDGHLGTCWAGFMNSVGKPASHHVRSEGFRDDFTVLESAVYPAGRGVLLLCGEGLSVPTWTREAVEAILANDYGHTVEFALGDRISSEYETKPPTSGLLLSPACRIVETTVPDAQDALEGPEHAMTVIIAPQEDRPRLFLLTLGESFSIGQLTG